MRMLSPFGLFVFLSRNCRCATGESWNGIMRDAMQKMDCLGPGCQEVYTITYFVSYIILVQFMMLNLFIAVLLEKFESVVVKDPEKKPFLGYNDIKWYSKQWARYSDPSIRSSMSEPFDRWMPVDRLETFLTGTRGALGLQDRIDKHEMTETEVEFFIEQLKAAVGHDLVRSIV